MRGTEICLDLCDLADGLRDQWLLRQSVNDSGFWGGLTVAQRNLFSMVRRLSRNYPEGVILRVLAEKLGLSSSAVSVMVDSLVRRGILERVPAAADRRKILIRPSAAGEAECRKYEGFWGEISDKFLQGCDDDKIYCFAEMLKQFNKYLTDINQEKEK